MTPQHCTRSSRVRPRTLLAALAAAGLLLSLWGCLTHDEADNHAPQILSLTATPNWTLTDSLVQLAVAASDPDGDPLSFQWSAAAGTFPRDSQRDSVLWQAPSSAQTCSLQVAVGDGDATTRGRLQIEVLEPDPHPHLWPQSLLFSAQVESQSLQVANTGTGVLTWSLSCAAGWVRFLPAEGATGPGADTVEVRVDRWELAEGGYTATLVLSTNAGGDSAEVQMQVEPPPVYGYEVVTIYPHDPGAFTQGLVYHEGLLYEGTGRHGESSLREVVLETGQVLRRVNLEYKYFGEGITLLDDRILQLTLSAGSAFIYDRETFERLGRFTYATAGWGLTDDGQRLVLSDGTDRLFFLDAQTYAFEETLLVRDLADRVPLLNELEYIGGEIYANIFGSDRIARISPRDGRVIGWIDLSGLLEHRGEPEVLNGIAYDAENGRLFVTGKYWPRLYEIHLTEPGSR